jgi:hypothetical protein
MQQITGKIIGFLPRQEGDSARGNHWVKAGFVIEYGDEYPARAAFSIFGEQRLQQFAGLKEGDEVIVDFNPQSREYNGHWYTDLQCILVTLAQNVQQPVQQQPTMTPQQASSNFYQTQPTAAVPPSSAMSQQTAVMQEDPDLPF